MYSLALVILYVIYTTAGLSAFVTFLIMENYSAATWALLTGLISAITLHLRCLKHRNKLNDWYCEDQLTHLRFIGFACFTLGFAGFVYHAVIELQAKIPIVPVSTSQIIDMVWAFMTIKSGIFLMFAARPVGYEPITLGVNERSSLIANA